MAPMKNKMNTALMRELLSRKMPQRSFSQEGVFVFSGHLSQSNIRHAAAFNQPEDTSNFKLKWSDST
jgi:hypothetical protein